MTGACTVTTTPPTELPPTLSQFHRGIFEGKQEARIPFYRVVELTHDTEDSAILRRCFRSMERRHYTLATAGTGISSGRMVKTHPLLVKLRA